MVADAGFSGVGLIAALRRHACLVTRLRIDASLFAPAPPRRPGQMGRPRLKGKHLPGFKTVLADPGTVWSRVTVAEARPRRCSGCSPWSRFGLMNWPAPRPVPSIPEPPHGMTSASQLSATPSPRSVALCGARRVYLCPNRARRPSKSPSPCCNSSRTPSATQPETRKVELNLCRIHGLGPYLALKLVGECGTNLSAWPNAKHFTSWLCLSPSNKTSGGKVLSSRT